MVFIWDVWIVLEWVVSGVLGFVVKDCVVAIDSVVIVFIINVVFIIAVCVVWVDGVLNIETMPFLDYKKTIYLFLIMPTVLNWLWWQKDFKAVVHSWMYHVLPITSWVCPGSIMLQQRTNCAHCNIANEALFCPRLYPKWAKTFVFRFFFVLAHQ